MKFSVLNGSEKVKNEYENLFFEQAGEQYRRLVIGPSQGQVELMLELAAAGSTGPWFALYVLLTPRLGKRSAGRYQGDLYESFAEVSGLFRDFAAYFEGDGRHHVWLCDVHQRATLVYDRHDVLFAYGPLEEWKQMLREKGFEERTFWFPAPHVHHYNKEFDGEEDRLLDIGVWRYFPLAESDEW
jgi:hypothetical protein